MKMVTSSLISSYVVDSRDRRSSYPDTCTPQYEPDPTPMMKLYQQQIGKLRDNIILRNEKTRGSAMLGARSWRSYPYEG